MQVQNERYKISEVSFIDRKTKTKGFIGFQPNIVWIKPNKCNKKTYWEIYFSWKECKEQLEDLKENDGKHIVYNNKKTQNKTVFWRIIDKYLKYKYYKNNQSNRNWFFLNTGD